MVGHKYGWYWGQREELQCGALLFIQKTFQTGGLNVQDCDFEGYDFDFCMSVCIHMHTSIESCIKKGFWVPSAMLKQSTVALSRHM